MHDDTLPDMAQNQWCPFQLPVIPIMIGEQVRDRLTGIEGTLTAFTGKTEAPERYAIKVPFGAGYHIVWLTSDRVELKQ